ncbi:tetratricopeptide repeat protein [Saccharopolyspora gloriosae]|uniref:ATP-binding protein n=1 Tax=Saccharopolyspora gloriosae TaxID=455344 RepID=UPI001FB7D194|nr:tetratricopeptide repeat protein [Saccharopolyspora gloriosae]
MGRESELDALTEAMRRAVETGTTVVLSALGGVGGVGKTWLALHWAHQHADLFPDGQLFVNLRGFDPSDKPVTSRDAVRGFLDALGIAPDETPPDLDAQIGLYRSLVAGKRMLVVLDNARDSDQVTPLLPGSATCTVLVTSRDRMAGLVTRHHANPVTVDALDRAHSEELLARRLGQERLDAEPDAVRDLVQWCAGLPLALSIVAGRAILDPHVPLTELAEELRNSSSRLDAFDEGTPATCLEAVLSWSCRALPPEQVEVFSLVGSAPGTDISVDAAASLTSLPVPKVRSILRALERVSLLQHHAAGRFRMHDLVRLHASERAQHDHTPSQREAALGRLMEHFVRTAHAADLLIAPHHAPIELGDLREGCLPKQLSTEDEAWQWFAAERANLTAAQHVAVGHGWHRAVWQLAWTLTTFQLRQGHLHDNLAAWEAGAQASAHLGDLRTKTRSYRHLGRACAQLNLHEQALQHLQAGLASAEEDGDRLGQAHTHRAIAVARERQGDYHRALEHALLALELYDELKIEVGGSHALNEVGWYSAKLGDFDTGHDHCSIALQRSREAGDRSGTGSALLSLGYIAEQTGRSADAVILYEKSLELFRELGDTSSEADLLEHLGHSLLASDPRRAREAWEGALALYAAQHRRTDAERLRSALDSLSDAATGD